jgi:hypothetical protein
VHVAPRHSQVLHAEGKGAGEARHPLSGRLGEQPSGRRALRQSPLRRGEAGGRLPQVAPLPPSLATGKSSSGSGAGSGCTNPASSLIGGRRVQKRRCSRGPELQPRDVAQNEGRHLLTSRTDDWNPGATLRP